jgi:hypothetical protein
MNQLNKIYYMEHTLPVEIWQKIVNLCDSLSQIRFCQISAFSYRNLRVTDLFNLDRSLLMQLNNEIIERFPYIVKSMLTVIIK